MILKVIANGFCIGKEAYFKSGWNKIDLFLVIISLIDVIITLVAKNSSQILRILRILRTLRPLRIINRYPGLKLVVTTLLSSLQPIGNIMIIFCTFFVILIVPTVFIKFFTYLT